MIRLSAEQLARIRAAAESDYPNECCGLLVGRRTDDSVTVTRVVGARNVRQDSARDRFEVDPKVRLDLERSLRGTEERVVGHYHSHPDHPARPSETDLAMAFEPDLVWLIVAVDGGRATDVRAFKLDERAGAFASVEIAGQ